ncbi:hypothetical protein GOP47_0005056 [Adiantum capillus-veneris]|uniref:non-specific serine/threonine protein kinase n=1 Tax=Adiantum capillus-veneris TaxID=13818 RepID=A0A9D4V558_ADICA|nr:hypothetical protein GOP47_0005056 [Adiantum capillus-veneris]
MEKASDDEGAALDDTPPDDASEEGSEFVEVDPSGRYGRYNEVLGKGAYKTVYKAFDDLDGIEVAWNQVKIHDVLHNAGDIDRLYSELHLLKTLKHKNIIKFYTSWVDTRTRNVNFITEIFTSGTLRQYCKKHKFVKLRAIKNWSRQILRGLVFLHSRDPPIIHRDLKCDNIFINGNNGEVKIGDLGLATILRQAPAAQSVIGTPEFMAPELYEEHYNELVDVYSFGMCLLEMLTSEYPYSECTNAAQIYRKVTMGKRPAALGKIKDRGSKEFVEKCLATASQRLHARELLMDPFLRSDEDLELQELSINGSANFLGGARILDPIPEHTYFMAADCHLFGQKYDEIAPKFLSASEGSPRLDTSSTGRLSLSDTQSPKDGMRSCKDFRIKGRKQDDKKVLVRIRIASSGGEVRIIQFDFDVDADTAMSVASEMVAELDLSDQDVTTIADMIDSEILALIPDWKPGLAFDDAIDNDVSKEQKELVLDPPVVQDERDDGLPVSTPGMTVGPPDDSQLASGPTYGRFEEVGCNINSSDQQQQDSDGLELFSDFSADSGSDFSLDAQSGSEVGVDNDVTTHSLEFVETEAKLDSLPWRQSGVDEVEFKEGHFMRLGSDEKLDDSEVLRLIMQQEEELQMLRTKHEEAISDLKMRITQDATLRIDKAAPKDSSICKISGEVLQMSRSQDESQPDAESEICVHGAETACFSTSISNGSLAAVNASEQISFASSLQVECASMDSVSNSDYVKGSRDMLASETQASMSNEPLTAQSKKLGDEEEHALSKVSIVTDDESKGAPNNTASAGMVETKSTAGLDKGAQVSKATAEVISLESRSLPPIHEDVKQGLTTLTKRESYLELYKVSNSKDKVSSSKSSESLGTLDGASKMAVPKDANQEQLKRMAEFADKMINNLSQSNSKYIGTALVKNVNLQNGQQGVTCKSHGGTTIQSGQHSKSVAGATIQNGQHSSAVKTLASVAAQNSQQGVIMKNAASAVIQNSTVKHLSSATMCNGQQAVSMKSSIQTSQQGTNGKGLSAAMSQNGQQSVLPRNLTSIPVQARHPVSSANINLGGTLQSGTPAKIITSGNAQAGQQVSTAGQARQQPTPTETTRA